MPLTSILSPLAGRGGEALGNDFENVFFICSTSCAWETVRDSVVTM
jgi:hypothetical protein